MSNKDAKPVHHDETPGEVGCTIFAGIIFLVTVVFVGWLCVVIFHWLGGLGGDDHSCWKFDADGYCHLPGGAYDTDYQGG